MPKENPTPEEIGSAILDFCKSYLIPPKYFLRIINDQKVVPMLRGKGMEFSAYATLENLLNEKEWSVQKLNLAAQHNSPDQDITVTHRRTGIQLKVESKSAVRGSFSLGARSKNFKSIPHFKVKCHRSRSNIKKAGVGNDRYKASDFDIILTNPENALYQGNTMGESFELLHNLEAVEFLKRHYKVQEQAALIYSAYSDWRFVIPPEIAEDGLIPRTPYVRLENDPHWYGLKKLEEKLVELVQLRRAKRVRSS